MSPKCIYVRVLDVWIDPSSKVYDLRVVDALPIISECLKNQAILEGTYIKPSSLKPNTTTVQSDGVVVITGELSKLTIPSIRNVVPAVK